MGLQFFEIEFDNPTKTYFSSQVIVGRVIVQVDQKEKHIQELVIRLSGKADVCWIDPHGKEKKPVRPKTSATPEIRISHSGVDLESIKKNEKVFSDEESYFDRRHTILEKKGAEELVIQPGRNSYPFEIAIPTGIPSSFEGEHGSVKYFLEATMKRAAGKFEHNFRTPIYVKGILDLNFDPQAQIERPEISQEDHMGCLCCTSGPIGFNFGILGKAGVLPGDKVEFLVDIYNMSNVRDVSTKLKFTQVTTYHAKPERKAVKKDLLKLKGPSVGRGGTGTWSGESIQIPLGIPPTKLGGRTTIINIEYYLEARLDIPGGKNISVQLPVIIGTVPFGSKVEDFLVAASPQPNDHPSHPE